MTAGSSHPEALSSRIVEFIGGLPARPLCWTLALLMALWSAADVLVLKVSGGLGSATFDSMVRHRLWSTAPDPRIVLLDIDESSLQRMSKEFGRWPWPRDTLATVLTYIENQEPAAIVWDILFADPDRLSPGGDAAFDAAAAASRVSHFSVVRLPASNDKVSQIRQPMLPGLWVTAGQGESTVALIPPALPGVASARLGFNNGVPDRDGVIRRFRYVEALPDGGVIQSTAWSAARTAREATGSSGRPTAASDEPLLIAWRASPNAYPRAQFADVFDEAESRSTASRQNFKGKIVIIGSTAPSLHDIHPTPLSPIQPGLETLATVIDNALNERFIRELPRSVQAALAVGLCIGLGVWVQLRSVASIEPWLLPLPAVLLMLGYFSLHDGSPVFLDLHVPAGLALGFIGILRLWNGLRRHRWCRLREPIPCGMGLWPVRGNAAWSGVALDRLIMAVERHAPDCRVVAIDANVSWPATLRWPEIASKAAIIGPLSPLEGAREAWLKDLQGQLASNGPIVSLPEGLTRQQVADWTLRLWAQNAEAASTS